MFVCLISFLPLHISFQLRFAHFYSLLWGLFACSFCTFASNTCFTWQDAMGKCLVWTLPYGFHEPAVVDILHTQRYPLPCNSNTSAHFLLDISQTHALLQIITSLFSLANNNSVSNALTVTTQRWGIPIPSNLWNIASPLKVDCWLQNVWPQRNYDILARASLPFISFYFLHR